MIRPAGTASPLAAPRPRSDVGVRREESGILGAALLATLAYHDLLDLPLTAVECWRYLLRPRSSVRVGERASVQENGLARSHASTLARFSLRDVEQTLTHLVRTENVETRHGFYFFPGRGTLVEERIERHARSQEKWRRLRRIAWWLQVVPFLRGLAATGSLAFENAKETSDLDVLVIAAPNRVWTVRFFLTVLLDAFGLRRQPRGETRDRVCLNHYLAEGALEFPYRSLYTAMEYARLIPILGEATCRRFRAANRAWMLHYLSQILPDALPHQKTIRRSPVLLGAQRALELLLLGPAGNAVERLLARFQRTLIARGEAAAAPGGRVVATEVRAEFHPHSREAPLLAAFNRRMETLGLEADFGNQQDSGLTI